MKVKVISMKNDQIDLNVRQANFSLVLSFQRSIFSEIPTVGQQFPILLFIRSWGEFHSWKLNSDSSNPISSQIEVEIGHIQAISRNYWGYRAFWKLRS